MRDISEIHFGKIFKKVGPINIQCCM